MNVQIESLRIDQSDLNTKRMLDLMAVSHDNGPMPLYLHTVNRVLREMCLEQQESGVAFNYNKFKLQIMAAALSPTQLGPLNQRLDMLESFMPDAQTRATQFTYGKSRANKKMVTTSGSNWTPVVCSFSPVICTHF